MYRIDSSGSVAVLPVPASALTPGFFQNGDINTGVRATVVDADWLNATQEEICYVIEQAGLVLNKTNRTQLLAAMQALINGIPRGSQVFQSVGTTNFVVPANVYQIRLEGWGNGGGGSGNAAGSLGSSGTSGVYARKRITGLTPGQIIPVTIPAAALGGAAGANPGQNGGSCSFGTFLTVPGGYGGTPSNSAGLNGPAPIAGVDLSIGGSPAPGSTVSGTVPIGVGGSGPRGGSGGLPSISGGQVGVWPGGGGGFGSNTGVAVPGGAGALGGFYVEW